GDELVVLRRRVTGAIPDFRSQQLAAPPERERPGLGALGRPRIEPPPAVRAGLEHPRLGVLVVALALEVVLEEREEDLLAVELAGLRGERHVAELVAVAAVPPAVHPRPHHQRVVLRRAVRLALLERLQRPEE